MSAPDIAVVIGTYNRADALDAVLWALSEQSEHGFEVIVADDGSGEEVADVVEGWSGAFPGRLHHVWQPDQGFRLARAFDLAAMSATADYLAFIPADVIPRRHFVRALRRSARPGWFLAGRRLRLAPSLTEVVLRERLPVHRWSLPRWLAKRDGVEGLVSLTGRDRRRIGARDLPDFEPEGRAYVLTALWRADFGSVNGYDTRYVGWGEEDVDLATRLRRLGLRCGHGGPHTTLVHLWHESREVVERDNWWLLQETELGDRVRAISGVEELAREVALS